MSAIPTRAREKVRERQQGACARCGNTYTALHHRQRRREGGHEVHNLVGLCQTDHDFVHSQVTKAQMQGYIIPPWVDEPWTVPVKAYYGWVLLLPNESILHLEQNVGTDALGWHNDNSASLITRHAKGTLFTS